MSFLLKTIGLDIAFRATADFLANHQYLLSSFFFPLRYRVCWYVFVWVLVWFVCVCSYSRRYFLVVLGTVLFTCFITLIDDLRYNFFLLLFFFYLAIIYNWHFPATRFARINTDCLCEWVFISSYVFFLFACEYQKYAHQIREEPTFVFTSSLQSNCSGLWWFFNVAFFLLF